jgi:hypothetical protein
MLQSAAFQLNSVVFIHRDRSLLPAYIEVPFKVMQWLAEKISHRDSRANREEFFINKLSVNSFALCAKNIVRDRGDGYNAINFHLIISTRFLNASNSFCCTFSNPIQQKFANHV